MKVLDNVQFSVKDGKLNLTADIRDAQPNEFRFPMQQQTVTIMNSDNIQWARHCQISNLAYFVKAFGNGMAIKNEDLVRLAALVEPKTTFPPLIKKQITEADLTAEVTSELDPDYQWQVTDSIKAGEMNWKDIPGQTSKTLDKSSVKSGQFVRLVASSEAGSITSNAIAIS